MKKLLLALLGALLVAPVPGWAAAPDDTYFPAQWGLTKIGAVDAWRRAEGRGAVVAVIDTGVDLSHPDLKGRLLAGRDFVDGDDDPRDENGHGTLIAGIIAAATDNGAYVASVAPRAKLLPVRVLDEDGNGISSNVAEGIDWAVARGADVINLSLAQEGQDDGGVLGDALLRDPSVGDAIEDAARAGVTVVVAAGNDRSGGRAETAYDAASGTGVIVVGASTTNDKLAAYSNHGDGLDIVAPGGGSPTNPGESGCTQNNSIVSTWWKPSTGESTVGGGCGTSMAVGFVSGVAALLHERGMSNVKAVQRMLSTAKDLGAAERDDRFGYGRLDAARAIGVNAAGGAGSSGTPAPRSTPSRRSGPVVAQGEPDPPPPSPSGSAATPSAAPTRSPREPEPPAVAFPAGRPMQTKGWPVSAAAAGVGVMVLAHVVVFLRRAEQRAG